MGCTKLLAKCPPCDGGGVGVRHVDCLSTVSSSHARGGKGYHVNSFLESGQGMLVFPQPSTRGVSWSVPGNKMPIPGASRVQGT